MNTTVTSNGKNSTYIAVPEQSNMAPNNDWSAVLVLVLSLALLSYNYAHGAIFWFNKVYYTGHEFLAYPAGFVGGLIAFMEIPMTVLYVNSVRLRDSIIAQTGYLFGLLLVIGLTTYMGSSSQNTLDELKTNQGASFDIQMQQFELKQQAALAKKQATMALAAQKDSSKAALYAAGAERRYQQELIKLNAQKALMMRNKPLEQQHGTGIFQISDSAFNMFWSFCVSVFVIFLTRYKVEYIQAVMRIPVVSLKNKLDHDWSTDKSDFQNTKMLVNPLKTIGSLGFLAMAKNKNITPITSSPTEEIQTENSVQNTSEIDTSEQFKHVNGVTYSNQLSTDGETSILRIYDKKGQVIFQQAFGSEENAAGIFFKENPDSPITKDFLSAIKKAKSDGGAPVPATGAHPSPETHPQPVPTRATQGRDAGDAPVPNNSESIDLNAIKNRLRDAKNATIGETINCVYCGEETKKVIETKKCCSTKCRKKLAKLSPEQKQKLIWKEEGVGQ